MTPDRPKIKILQYLLAKTLLFALENPSPDTPKTVPSECKVAFRTPVGPFCWPSLAHFCLLYTSDAADE